ncbi:MAG: DegV family protein, partial [Dehalococcoidia bacterium]|nr:DegV family protein [Dehalococcoidia bacterium]
GALDTLKYLEKGGRIGKAQALVGSMLHIKPMISVRDGIVVPLEKVRTHAKAIERLYQLAAERMPAREIGVIYSTEFEEAEMMVKRLQELAPTQHIYLSRFGPCLGTYVGPGSLGVITLT